MTGPATVTWQLYISTTLKICWAVGNSAIFRNNKTHYELIWHTKSIWNWEVKKRFLISEISVKALELPTSLHRFVFVWLFFKGRWKKLLKSTKCQWQYHQSGELLAGQMSYKTTTKSFHNERTKRHYEIMRHHQLNPLIPWNPPEYTYQTLKPKSGTVAGECLTKKCWGA